MKVAWAFANAAACCKAIDSAATTWRSNCRCLAMGGSNTGKALSWVLLMDAIPVVFLATLRNYALP